MFIKHGRESGIWSNRVAEPFPFRVHPQNTFPAFNIVPHNSSSTDMKFCQMVHFVQYKSSDTSSKKVLRVKCCFLFQIGNGCCFLPFQIYWFAGWNMEWPTFLEITFKLLSLAWSQYILLRPHWSNTTQHHPPHLIIVQLFQICNETISFSLFIPLHFNISHRQQKYLLSRVHLNIYKAPRKYIHNFSTQTLSINLNFLTSFNPSLPTCKTFPQLQRSKIIMFSSILLLHQI